MTSSPLSVHSSAPVFVPGFFLTLEGIVARECGVTTEEMRAVGKQTERVQARWVLWYIGKKRFSAARLGRFYEMDHTTVLHGIHQVERRVELMELAAGILARHRAELPGF